MKTLKELLPSFMEKLIARVERFNQLKDVSKKCKTYQSEKDIQKKDY